MATMAAATRTSVYRKALEAIAEQLRDEIALEQHKIRSGYITSPRMTDFKACRQIIEAVEKSLNISLRKSE